MKIMIIGSMAFASQMIEMKERMEALGHTALVPADIEYHLKDPALKDSEKEHTHATSKDVLRSCFKLVAQSEAVLVLNLERNGIKGYVGTSALMEIGLAYYLRKKIFLLNSVAPQERYATELAIMGVSVINNDLEKISRP